MTKKPCTRRAILILLAYVLGNVVFFLWNPFASPWHYHTANPLALTVEHPGDEALSLEKLESVCDEIDLAYQARTPTASEQTWGVAANVMSVVFLPASFALGMKEFGGYIGPANSAQQEFTLSVKRRYNHLVVLALRKGSKREGWLFEVDPGLSKKKGASFSDVRAK